MLTLLLRLFFLCFGALLAFDALLPTATQTLKVERHSVHSSSKGRGDSYYIEFDNYRVSSCSVGKQKYHALKDGDELLVKSTRLLKHCVKIEKEGVVVSDKQLWRLLGILLGAGFIAYGVGWFKPEQWRSQR
jgi:hypothetical protein